LKANVKWQEQENQYTRSHVESKGLSVKFKPKYWHKFKYTTRLLNVRTQALTCPAQAMKILGLWESQVS